MPPHVQISGKSGQKSSFLLLSVALQLSAPIGSAAANPAHSALQELMKRVPPPQTGRYVSKQPQGSGDCCAGTAAAAVAAAAVMLLTQHSIASNAAATAVATAVLPMFVSASTVQQVGQEYSTSRGEEHGVNRIALKL
jgi:hypothetical protein